MDIEVKAKQLIDKACLDLSRHPTTRAFSPFFMDGEVVITDVLPTAATDGFKEYYNPAFTAKLPNGKQVAFLVLHEKGHKFLMHLIRETKRMKEQHKISNIAMDYAINGLIIDEIIPQAPDLVEKIPCALYDVKYKGWAFEEIFEDLMQQAKGMNPDDFESSHGDPLDQHDRTRVDSATGEELKTAADDISESLRQGQMMAGVVGGDKSISVENALAPRVDWVQEMQEFFTENTKGQDDISFRRFNRRGLAMDLYMPSMVQETMDELVAAFDVSASMESMIPMYAAALQDAALATKPNKIRILWWDTQVTSEQVFTDYEGLAAKMQPTGGGGTKLTSVSNYLQEQKIAPSSLLVFTDGEVEDNVEWRVSCPTLWFVHGRKAGEFAPPSGRLVKVAA
jgi:predicted metal-dependent peptidase